MNLLDMLINKTVEIAIEKGIIKSKSIIVDATHTKSRYNQKSPKEILTYLSKKLRKSVYEIYENMKEKFPAKTTTDALVDEIEYCQKLINVIEIKETISQYPKVSEKLNLLKETIEDDIEHLQISADQDARIGHKTADSSFFEYKTHIAMSEERIITGAIITTGEKNDGKQLEALITKSIEAGIEVETIIGDTAYSEKKNIEYSNEHRIRLVAKLNPSITQGFRKKEDELEFNKDAGMYICKSGHMAVKKAGHSKKGANRNPVVSYYFDIEKCKKCEQREGCYKEGSKSKSYTVCIKSDEHTDQFKFEKSDYFKKNQKSDIK